MPSAKTAKNASTTKQSKKRKAPHSSYKKTEAPVFLRKTFHLIDSLSKKGDVASWASDGKSFVVKDPDRFAKEAIPQCFNHNKFSSFVRQLNFYGFRKLKPENQHIYLKDIDHTREKWAYFFHPQFQRGHEEWLKDIHKTHQVEAADKQEVGALKSEVKSLQSQVKNLTANVEILASLVRDMHRQLQQKQNNEMTDDITGPETKKRRMSVSPDPIFSSPMVVHPVPQKPVTPPVPMPPTTGAAPRQPSVDLSLILKDEDLALNQDMDVMIPDETKSFSLLPPLKSGGGASSRQASADLSFSLEDKEFLDSLFEEEAL